MQATCGRASAPHSTYHPQPNPHTYHLHPHPTAQCQPHPHPTPNPLPLHLSGPEACAPCATVRPTGRYDVGSAGTPEALRKQLLALQKQPAAMRALRDAMLLEGKVTQSD